MKVNINGRNMDVSDRVAEYAEKKLDRLERYLPNIIDASLELRTEKQNGKDHPVAQLTIRNNRGVVLRVEDKKQDDVFASIDVVVDKMYKQISRYKGKTQKRKGSERWIETAWDTVETVPVTSDDLVEDYDREPKRVLRRKAVLLTPMSENEAIDQMELLGHNFFLFYNGEEDTMNVLYRREDGNYGILTPRID